MQLSQWDYKRKYTPYMCKQEQNISHQNQIEKPANRNKGLKAFPFRNTGVQAKTYVEYVNRNIKILRTRATVYYNDKLR